MCGRATLTDRELNDVLQELNAEVASDDAALFRPRYNIAPSDVHWIVEAGMGPRRLLLPAVWGYLVPGRQPHSTRPLINVRGEQLAARRGFRDAFESRRCLVVTDGFLEWDHQHRPFWYHRPDGGLVLLAGLYQPPAAGSRPRFTVLTTRPNGLVAPVHDRMPVIIPREHLDDWLTGEPAQAATLIAPAPEAALVGTPVSRRVNAVKNDDPHCLAPPDEEPAPGAPRQGTLF